TVRHAVRSKGAGTIICPLIRWAYREHGAKGVRPRRGVLRNQRALQPSSVVRRKAYEKLLEKPHEHRHPSRVRNATAIQGGQSARPSLARGGPCAVYDSGGCARRPTRAGRASRQDMGRHLPKRQAATVV